MSPWYVAGGTLLCGLPCRLKFHTGLISLADERIAFVRYSLQLLLQVVNLVLCLVKPSLKSIPPVAHTRHLGFPARFVHNGLRCQCSMA
jgi:hypothetical protein